MTKISANPSRNTELKLPIFKKRKKEVQLSVLLYISHQISSFSMRVEQTYMNRTKYDTLSRTKTGRLANICTHHIKLNCIFSKLEQKYNTGSEMVHSRTQFAMHSSGVDNTLHTHTLAHTVKTKNSTDHFCEEGKIDHSHNM